MITLSNLLLRLRMIEPPISDLDVAIKRHILLVETETAQTNFNF